MNDLMTSHPNIPVTGVDSHAHVFGQALALTAERRYSPAYDATLAAWLGHLDAHGLSHGVLVQPSFLGTDNSHMLAAIARAPERLKGVAVVEEGASAEQLQALARQGVVGIRLNLVGKPMPDLGAPHWKPLLQKVAQMGLHVELHRQIEDIPSLCQALLAQGCKVVIDHFGRPRAGLGVKHETFTQLLALGASERVWVKVSAVYRLGGTHAENLAFAEAAVPQLFEHFGDRQLVWGSDWPHTQHEDQIDYASQYELLGRIAPQQRWRDSLMIEGPKALFGF